MRDDVPSTFSDPNRTITATIGLKPHDHGFKEIPMAPLPYNFSTYTERKAGNELYRWGIVAGDNNIYKCTYTYHHYTVEEAIDEVTSSVLRQMPGGVPISEEYRDLYVQEDDSECWAAVNGIVYQFNYLTDVWDILANLIDGATSVVPKIKLTFVGTGSDIVVAAVYSGTGVSDHCKISFIKDGAVDTWPGILPRHNTKPGIAARYGWDDVQNENTDNGNYQATYIYVDDWSGKRPIMLKRFGPGFWSATKPILSIDALDEESAFKVGSIANVGYSGDRIFLTGLLKRQYGPTYSVVMRGSERFTFDRNLIVAVGVDEPLSIHWGDDYYLAVGRERAFTTQGEPQFFLYRGGIAGLDITALSAQRATNAADQLHFELPGHYLEEYAEDLLPGTEVNLGLTVNGQALNEGSYSIDRIRKTEGTEEASYSVDCSGLLHKKLMDWESDTYFDYMGQGEAHGDPGDLTKLIRFSGGHFQAQESGGLQLTSLNDDGMLYTTPPASHGGFIKCKFNNLQTTNTMVGIGLNYGEETLAQAATRMGKKIEDTKGTDRGRWGLFAIYYPDPLYYGGQVWLCDFNTIRKGYSDSTGTYPNISNPWRVIKQVDVARPGPLEPVVLAMQYQDGFARVYYANSDIATLTQIIACEAIFERDVHPSEHDNYGRGAIYLRNNTGAHMAYPTTSDCDVVPLYSLADKYAVTGVPLQDRTDKFPALWGNVRVDSEYILYKGIAGWVDGKAGDRRTPDLTWVPGEVLLKWGDGENTPEGTDMDFARYRGTRDITPHTHGNNYVLQKIPLYPGVTVTAVRVWLKKINFPEDEVTLTINIGQSSHPVQLANATVTTARMGPNSKLTEAGGWVTFFLDSDVTIQSHPSGDTYWIMIRRNKNWNHPSSYAYFQYKLMTHEYGSAYVFCEEDDALIPQGGDIAHVIYGKVEGSNKEFCIPVRYFYGLHLPETDPSETYFAGCAVTITVGPGIYNCYRIIRSRRYTSPLGEDLYLFFVDRSPGQIFDFGTKLRAVPAFFELYRGRASFESSSTIPIAHGGNSMVHMPTNTFALASYFEYFTADEDLTLAEVAREIHRKAGVIQTNLCNRDTIGWHTFPNWVGGDVTIHGGSAISQNAIIVMQMKLRTDEADRVIVVFDGADGPVAKVDFQEEEIGGVIKGYISISAGGPRLLSLLIGNAIEGTYRISLFDKHLSVWCDGRIVISAHLGDMPTWYNWHTELHSGDIPGFFGLGVMVPQAGTRVDNFVMDMGKTGMQLLQTLIGEKRIYHRRSGYGPGAIQIYTDRESRSYDDPYDRATSITSEKTDIGLATRVLIEGGEVVEVSSAGNIIEYGNLFKSVHFNEINDLADVQYFAEMIQEDMLLNREVVEVTGAADPSIEPTDILYITMKDGTRRRIVVDAISFDMQIDEADATYDMRISGRYMS